MTDQHRATPEQWESIKRWAEDNVYDACFLELRARIEALEAAQPHQDKLDRLIAIDRDDPANSPVERIATDTFRALCAELTTTLENTWDIRPKVIQELLDRARAALAQPEPVAPTDEELDEFAVFWWGSDTDERTVTDVIECCSMTAYARAVLARWGTLDIAAELEAQ
jgi:hypothetical protein